MGCIRPATLQHPVPAPDRVLRLRSCISPPPLIPYTATHAALPNLVHFCAQQDSSLPRRSVAHTHSLAMAGRIEPENYVISDQTGAQWLLSTPVVEAVRMAPKDMMLQLLPVRQTAWDGMTEVDLIAMHMTKQKLPGGRGGPLPIAQKKPQTKAISLNSTNILQGAPIAEPGGGAASSDFTTARSTNAMLAIDDADDEGQKRINRRPKRTRVRMAWSLIRVRAQLASKGRTTQPPRPPLHPTALESTPDRTPD